MLIKAVFIGPKLEEHRIYDYNLNSCFLLDFKYNLLMWWQVSHYASLQCYM